MKKFLLTLLAFFGVVSLFACDGNKPVEDDRKPVVFDLDYAEGTKLNMAVVHDNAQTTITFDSKLAGNGLKLADGKTYNTGDLKPAWEALQDKLKVSFTNVYTGAKSAANEYKAWKNLNFEGVDVVVGNASDMAEDGRAGNMVDLSLYLDLMPNFSNFLKENPIVNLSVLSDTTKGSIYYAPYFDGYDDIEKYFIMRVDWVEKLLDGDGEFTATTTDKFGKTTAYTPYMQTSGKLEVNSLTADGSDTQTITKNYDTKYGNIVDYMNKNVTADTTGVELVNMLRGYIDEAYNGIYGKTRSHLFTGYDACWDADELVALLRCIVTNTFTLTGQNDNKVQGIFPRESELNRTSDLLSLVSMFGARGYESRNDMLYFDGNNVLCDARGSEDMIKAANKLNELYKEGLILADFDKKINDSAKIGELMYKNNQGFMIYDYVQTQCLYNEHADIKGKIEGFNLSPVINPVAKWFDGTNENGVWMRFTESWRSVKTNGWGIPATCTGDQLKAALRMFDYVYSDEGQILMSYGPDAWRSGQTIDYKGEQVPEISSAAWDELWNLASGNFTNYARQYIGSTLPIGYVKDQGFEYQCTTENGKAGALKVSQAIAKGVVKHVSPEISDNLFYTMVPTVLPLTKANDAQLAEITIIGTNGVYSKTKGKGTNIFLDTIKYGLGSNQTLSGTHIDKMPASVEAYMGIYNDKVSVTYIKIQQNAWKKLKAYYDKNIAK